MVHDCTLPQSHLLGVSTEQSTPESSKVIVYSADPKDQSVTVPCQHEDLSSVAIMHGIQCWGGRDRVIPGA